MHYVDLQGKYFPYFPSNKAQCYDLIFSVLCIQKLKKLGSLFFFKRMPLKMAVGLGARPGTALVLRTLTQHCAIIYWSQSLTTHQFLQNKFQRKL